ncbi:MAG TPA: hypothetical protein VMM15_03015 [Bradyrhizobium sp.]|nr:hypothetical protein [Bradyrhizobium sp.]
MIRRLIESPMRVPCGFVVKNASKMRSVSSMDNPTPESITEIDSSPFALLLDTTISSPPIFLHRLDAVEHEVHRDLLQLNAIRRRRGKPRGELGPDRDRMPAGQIAQQKDHLSNDVVEVDPLMLRSPSLVAPTRSTVNSCTRPPKGT